MDYLKGAVSNISEAASNLGDRASEGVTNVINKSNDTLTTDTGSVNVSIIISIVLILMIIYIAMYYHRQSAYSPYLLLDVTSTGGNNAVIVQPNKIPLIYNTSVYPYFTTATCINLSYGKFSKSHFIILSLSSANKFMLLLDNACLINNVFFFTSIAYTDLVPVIPSPLENIILISCCEFTKASEDIYTQNEYEY